jgi:ankyrin repeat protein
MYAAASRGDIAAMEVLVQNGADVNCSPGSAWHSDGDHAVFGERPLNTAVAYGQSAAVAWLLQQGATTDGSGPFLSLKEDC